MSIATKRLLKEWKAVQSETYHGLEFIAGESLLEWFVDMVVDNPLCPDMYRLRFRMNKDYPLESPSVQFITSALYLVPIHPHIYSNGHICLDLLGSNWTPVHTVASVSISIQSMLVLNGVNERPPDDERYSRNAPNDPKKTQFVYHDDTV